MLRVRNRDRGSIPFSRRRFYRLEKVQIKPGVHLASYLKVTERDFPEGKAARS
jgi:hypothetical protein